MTRHLPDHFEHFEHRRAPANNSVEFEVGEELLLQAANALPAMEGFGKLVQ